MRSLLHPSVSLRGALGVVRAYVDESADERKRYAYAVAGLIGSEEQWLGLELLWEDRTADLKNAFHMNECETFHGEFEGWDVSKKQSLITDLTGIIRDSKLYGFGSSVDIPTFHSVFPDEPKDALYFLCFRHVICQMSFWGTEAGQRVAFVFDRQQEFAQRAHRLFDRLRKSPAKFGASLGSLAFEDRRKFVALQAADLVAYETFKIQHHTEHDTARSPRRSLLALRRTGRFFIRHWDRAVLEGLRREMEKHGHSRLMKWMLSAEVMSLVPEKRT
jgi:hypothetical protein